jgi:hypothetical protein
MATISTHNGSSVSRGHNLRKKNIVDKEEHIDPNGVHETWVDEAPRMAYERLFGDSVRAYNDKQSRADRKIDDYYNHVRADEKRHNVYEMIIGVYPAEGEIVSDSPEAEPAEGTVKTDKQTETCKEILKDFVNDWKRRNPNLEMVGAYYHADEQGKAPHVHIDYIPVAHGYKKGPGTQTALVKALGEQGFTIQPKRTAQMQWEKSENDYLESLCVKRGLNVEHPQQGHGVEHLHTKTFKAQKEVAEETQRAVELAKAFYGDPEEIKQEATKLQNDVDNLTEKIQNLTSNRDAAKQEASKAVKEVISAQETLKSTKTEINEAERTLKALQGHILTAEETKAYSVKKSLFGANKAVIEGTPEELQSLVATAQKVDGAEAKMAEAQMLEQQARNILNQQNAILQSATDESKHIKEQAEAEAKKIISKATEDALEASKQAKRDNTALNAENANLRQENANIRQTIADIKKNATEDAQREAEQIINQAYKDAGTDRLNERLQKMIGLVPLVEVRNAKDDMMTYYKSLEHDMTADEKEMFHDGNTRGVYDSLEKRLGVSDMKAWGLKQKMETYQNLKDSPHTIEDVMKSLEQRQTTRIRR